jgi:uncharacterized membrane protein YccC
MRIGYREMIFSLNSYAAAILALYLSFCWNLDKPYWAMMTAYVTSQPFTGALRSKAVYRLIGTVFGAAMTVLIIPPLSNAPVLLSIAMALWVGVCLFFSLLDRTPRSYVFLLAGYTAAFIGFPIVGLPTTAFNVAVSRVEEICVGVLCASFFHTIFFPRNLRQSLSYQFQETVVDLKSWLADTLVRKRGAVRRKGRIRLAADITDLHLSATHIPFDTYEPQQIGTVIAAIENKLIQLFPLITGLSDRFKRLETNGRLPERLNALLTDVSTWLEAPTPLLIAGKSDIQKKCLALKNPRGTPGWQDLLLFNIATRLSELVDVFVDCRQRVDSFASRKAHIASPMPDAKTRGERVLHTDYAAALRSALTCVGLIFFGSQIWIATGWPEGDTAVLMAGVTYCLFASQANPVPAQKVCLYYTLLSSIVAGIYLFFILPNIHSFPVMAIALAPVLLTIGVLLAKPRTGTKFMSFVIPFCGSLTLTNYFNPDFAVFLNRNAAQFIGIAVVVAATAILHRFSARERIHGVLHKTWGDIGNLASGTARTSSTAWRSLMVDRIGLLAPYVDVIKSSENLRSVNAMRELRTGLNVIRLKRASARLAPDLGADVEVLLQAIGDYFSFLAAQQVFTAPPEFLLRQIDIRIASLSAMTPNKLKDTILNALTGLRCNLFPQAGAYMYEVDRLD